MRKLSLVMLVVAGIWAIPGRAEATMAYCPPSLGPTYPTATFQYGVDTDPTGTQGSAAAVCLAYGDQTNIGQGGGNDGFLYPVPGDTHVVTPYNPADYTLVGQFGFDQGGQASGTYTFNGVANTQYVLGVSDGTQPKWAAFLLPLNDFDGTWTITGGRSLSHLVLYRGPTTGSSSGGADGQELVPEPASLLLLGSGLSAMAMRVRRRKRQASA